jgi:O-succinylbenzoic acid--CoA ligase
LKINTKNIRSQAYIQDIIRLKERWFSKDPNFLVQTSGSTGQPKTISLQKEHMGNSARATLKFLNIEEGSQALLCLPIDKIGGIMMFVRAAEANLDLTILEPSSKPFDLLEENVNFALSAMVPLQISQSLAQLQRAGKLIAGGGPLSPRLIRQIIENKAQLWHSYGMTETISHIALRQISPVLADAFKVLPGVTISLNEQSCLTISAPAIGVEKLETKDLAQLIGEDQFLWKGRLDNVVLSGGLKLYPEELEQKIDLSKNFILAGRDNPNLGQELLLIIESEQPLDEQHRIAALARLDRLERPKKILYLKSFIYTSNGKIKRSETLSQALALGPNKG